MVDFYLESVSVREFLTKSRKKHLLVKVVVESVGVDGEPKPL